MTLTEFLLARIDEQESLARRSVAALLAIEGVTLEYDPVHIVNDARAKRRIVEGLEPFGELDDINAPELLGILAEPYADHPDFRQEWRP